MLALGTKAVPALQSNPLTPQTRSSFLNTLFQQLPQLTDWV
jgi:hypothetical protein